MQRNARQAMILEIISKQDIETQDELCSELLKRNFNVTQATISRDIKDLKLYKVAGTTKKYKYAYIEGDGDAVNNKMHNLFRECVQSINWANNIIVIKTMRGNGSTAGAFVDMLQYKEIIGTVAGDDTVLIVVDSTENTSDVALRLKDHTK